MDNRKKPKWLAEVIAEFVVREKFESVPHEAVEKAKEFALDLIGCMVGSSNRPQINILTEVLQAEGGNSRSSVVAHGFKTSMMNAALLNGTSAHALDFDDDHREGTMHPSAAVFPAVLAMGENRGVSGKEFLLAYVLGLEVMIRLGESFLGKSYYQGFHPTGTCGVFGAAASCAKVIGLDVERTKYALGIAGSFASGTQECTGEGAWQKPLQAGHPAMGGVLAASLAEKHFIGAGTVFDGPNGLIRAFSFKDQFDYRRITESLGQKWEMKDTSIKMYACCRFCGPVFDCAVDLYRQGVRSDNVKRIVAKVGDFSIKMLCNPIEQKLKPKTHVDAQFSLPWAIATAICKNKGGMDEFGVEALKDAQVLAVAEKVAWEFDPEAEAMYPRAYPATLIAELNDGSTLRAHVDYPKGDPENPATKPEIISKFHSLTGKYLDKQKRENIISAVDHLDKLANIAELTDLIR